MKVRHNTYHLRVIAEIVTHESAAVGDFDRHEEELDVQLDSIEEIRDHLDRYGVALHPDADWLYSVDPVLDRAHFELGEYKTYSAFVTRKGEPLCLLPEPLIAAIVD